MENELEQLVMKSERHTVEMITVGLEIMYKKITENPTSARITSYIDLLEIGKAFGLDMDVYENMLRDYLRLCKKP